MEHHNPIVSNVSSHKFITIFELYSKEQLQLTAEDALEILDTRVSLCTAKSGVPMKTMRGFIAGDVCCIVVREASPCGEGFYSSFT